MGEKTSRKFYMATSKHRPDGLDTIWVVADRAFSKDEADAKLNNVISGMIEPCGTVLASVNDQVAVKLHEDRNIVEIWPARVIEVVVPSKCAVATKKFIKGEFGGKWKETEAEWKRP